LFCLIVYSFYHSTLNLTLFTPTNRYKAFTSGGSDIDAKSASNDLLKSGKFRTNGELKKFIEQTRNAIKATRGGISDAHDISILLSTLPSSLGSEGGGIRPLVNLIKISSSSPSLRKRVLAAFEPSHVDMLLSDGGKEGLLVLGMMCDEREFVEGVVGLSEVWNCGGCLVAILSNHTTSSDVDDSEGIQILVGSIVKKVISVSMMLVGATNLVGIVNELVSDVDGGSGLDVVSQLCDISSGYKSDKSLLTSYLTLGGLDGLLSLGVYQGNAVRRQVQILLARIIRVYCPGDDVNDEEQKVVEEIFGPVLVKEVSTTGEWC